MKNYFPKKYTTLFKCLVISLILSISIITLLTGCSSPQNGYILDVNSTEDIDITFDALLYDNSGNHYATFRGHTFNINSNRIKQYGYSSSGEYTSWFETSSVVTVEIDNNYIQTCGSTVIFKDSRLELLEIPTYIESNTSTDAGYETNIGHSPIESWIELTHWWYDIKEKGQGGSKIILIQSQHGDNIGAIIGENITWEVAERLPKTTLINVDGKALYIHRCNFTIIDTALFDTSPKPTYTE